MKRLIISYAGRPSSGQVAKKLEQVAAGLTIVIPLAIIFPVCLAPDILSAFVIGIIAVVLKRGRSIVAWSTILVNGVIIIIFTWAALDGRL